MDPADVVTAVCRAALVSDNSDQLVVTGIEACTVGPVKDLVLELLLCLSPRLSVQLLLDGLFLLLFFRLREVFHFDILALKTFYILFFSDATFKITTEVE